MTSTDSAASEQAEGEANEGDDASEAKSDENATEEPAEKKSSDRARIEAERERIAKENQRKQDEYQEKLKQARQTVRDLNFRFADWYYVVSEDMFKKIRLTRAEAIQDKESVEEEGYGVDAFRSLEGEGLNKTPAAATPQTQQFQHP